jgi:hypothetical protein
MGRELDRRFPDFAANLAAFINYYCSFSVARLTREMASAAAKCPAYIETVDYKTLRRHLPKDFCGIDDDDSEQKRWNHDGKVLGKDKLNSLIIFLVHYAELRNGHLPTKTFSKVHEIARDMSTLTPAIFKQEHTSQPR